MVYGTTNSAKIKTSRNTAYQAAAMSREPQNRVLHDSLHCAFPDPFAASIGSSMMDSSASVSDASWFGSVRFGFV